MKAWTAACLACVASRAGFGLIGAVFCASTLHVAKRVGPTPPYARNVSITMADKTNLSAWWLLPSVANGNCVAVLHGIGDSRVGSAGFAPMFLNPGYAVLLPDSRAHGASGGEFVTYGLLEKYDTIAWAHWMRSAGCGKIYGLGESLGASVLIQAAAVEPAFAAIVAECPFADLRKTAEYRLGHMLNVPDLVTRIVVESGMLYARLADGFDFSKVSPLRSIETTATPILLIHGLADTRTPPTDSRQLARANPQNQLWLVPNAEHTGAAAAAPEEFRNRVLSWFGTTDTCGVYH